MEELSWQTFLQETPKLLVNWDICKIFDLWMQKLELIILKIWLQIRIPRLRFTFVNLYNISLLSRKDPSFIGMQRWRLMVPRFTCLRPVKRWARAPLDGARTTGAPYPLGPGPSVHRTHRAPVHRCTGSPFHRSHAVERWTINRHRCIPNEDRI